MEKRDEVEAYDYLDRGVHRTIKKEKQRKSTPLERGSALQKRSSPPTNSPLVPSSFSGEAASCRPSSSSYSSSPRIGDRSNPPYRSHPTVAAAIESTPSQVLLNQNNGCEHPLSTGYHEHYARTPIAAAYPPSSCLSSCDSANSERSSSSSGNPSPHDYNYYNDDAGSPAARLSPPMRVMSHGSHTHCTDIAEVLDALHLYISRQAKLIHRLHSQVQDMRRELNQCSGTLSRPHFSGEAKSNRTGARYDLSTSPKPIGNSNSSSCPHCNGSEDAWRQEIRRIVQEELQRNQRENASASFSAHTHTLTPEAVESREVLVQHGERLMHLEARLEEQQEDTTVVHQSISKLSEMINGIIKDAQESKEKDAVERSLEQNRKNLELEAIRADIQRELTSVRQEARDTVEMAFAEHRRTFLNDHEDGIAQLVSKVVGTQLQESAKSVQKESQSFCTSRVNTVQQHLSALQQHCSELITRMDHLDQEQSRLNEVHRFNSSLYEEFKSWLTDVEERMVNRSEWIQWTHQMESK